MSGQEEEEGEEGTVGKFIQDMDGVCCTCVGGDKERV